MPSRADGRRCCGPTTALQLTRKIVFGDVFGKIAKGAFSGFRESKKRSTPLHDILWHNARLSPNKTTTNERRGYTTWGAEGRRVTQVSSKGLRVARALRISSLQGYCEREKKTLWTFPPSLRSKRGEGAGEAPRPKCRWRIAARAATRQTRVIVRMMMRRGWTRRARSSSCARTSRTRSMALGMDKERSTTSESFVVVQLFVLCAPCARVRVRVMHVGGVRREAARALCTHSVHIIPRPVFVCPHLAARRKTFRFVGGNATAAATQGIRKMDEKTKAKNVATPTAQRHIPPLALSPSLNLKPH